MTSNIQAIRGRQILDSRGTPTVEVDVILESGVLARASVPSGASTGSREARERRDGDPHCYAGKSVYQAVEAVNRMLNDALVGMDVMDQAAIDARMLSVDGTADKANIGANAILGVSLAVARAAAQSAGIPLYAHIAALSGKQGVQLPVPMMNILNGGAHANNPLDIQEFMIIPVGAKRFSHGLQMGTEIFYALKAVLNKQGLSTTVGDEGGFAPMSQSHEEALRWIMTAITDAGYTPGTEVKIALDIASSELYANSEYRFESNNSVYSSQTLTNYYQALCQEFPIVSIEDGMDESDWDGWKTLTQGLGASVQLVGDDLFVTNPNILQKGIDANVGNAILIKVNQIGTLTETLAAIQLAQANGYGVIVSHRSGETEDTFIADLAVGTHAGQIKTGSLSRSDRLAKYNQLLRIESELGTAAVYNTPF